MTTRDSLAWRHRRPIYNRLPEVGYQDNQVVDALTYWADGKLSDTKDLLESWYRELSPDTCKDSSLDYLAYLVGFSGDYWDLAWTPEVKRELIRLSHWYLWPHKGTLKVIRTLMEVHGIPHDVWTTEQLRLRFTMPKVFGGSGALRYYVRLPITVQRDGRQWDEAKRTVRAYSPAVCQAAVCYQKFYLGFSRVGDPLFKKTERPLYAPLVYDSFRTDGPVTSATRPDLAPADFTYLEAGGSASVVNGQLLWGGTEFQLRYPSFQNFELTLDLEDLGDVYRAILFRSYHWPNDDIRVVFGLPGQPVQARRHPGDILVGSSDQNMTTGNWKPSKVVIQIYGERLKVYLDGVLWLNVHHPWLNGPGIYPSFFLPECKINSLTIKTLLREPDDWEV